jgi:hypothetical protein
MLLSAGHPLSVPIRGFPGTGQAGARDRAVWRATCVCFSQPG